MSEQNKALARRYFEAENNGNLAAMDELIAADVVVHGGLFPELPSGPAGIKEIHTTLRTAFPDISVTVEDMIAEGDKVVTRWTIRGTHKGELMGIAPTGKQITEEGIEIFRIAGGKIVEIRLIHDRLGLMQQLGVIPS